MRGCFPFDGYTPPLLVVLVGPGDCLFHDHRHRSTCRSRNAWPTCSTQPKLPQRAITKVLRQVTKGGECVPFSERSTNAIMRYRYFLTLKRQFILSTDVYTCLHQGYLGPIGPTDKMRNKNKNKTMKRCRWHPVRLPSPSTLSCPDGWESRAIYLVKPSFPSEALEDGKPLWSRAVGKRYPALSIGTKLFLVTESYRSSLTSTSRCCLCCRENRAVCVIVFVTL